MATVVSRKVGKNTYYYIRHTTGTEQAEEYLGSSVPQDIEQRKARFVLEFYRKKWIPRLQAIQNGFIKNNKKTPTSLIEESIREFSIVFTYHTNRIEGSTLSLQDTIDLIRHGLTPLKKRQSDATETLLHVQTFMNMMQEKRDLSAKTILEWHRKIFEKTKPEFAGKFRSYNVRVTNSSATFPPHQQVKERINGFFRWYDKAKTEINPVELAALVHLKFVSIHPFGDGNGRMSRLMMNYVLARSTYPLFLIEYKGRMAYYLALERSQTELTDMPFLQWFMKRYIGQHYRHYVS